MSDDFIIIQRKVWQICDAVRVLTRMDNYNNLKAYEPTIELSVRFEEVYFAEIKLGFVNNTIVIPNNWVGVGETKLLALDNCLFRIRKEIINRISDLSNCLEGIENLLYE